MPKVTIVTPNYDHARFLTRRLESILAQTFQDFELIILDNASTDSSREVIEPFTKDPRVRVIFNARNNGSTFKQWNLGLSHAKGDYVWFAESDDYAEPALLAALVDRLDRHPGVGLACCQSWVTDEDDNILFNYLHELESCHQSDRWRTDYVNSGHDECIRYLFLFNTIPNASAVLLRRLSIELAGGVPQDMHLCGDWMTYINILHLYDIAFVSKPLNYFRQHQGTVRSRFSKQGWPVREWRKVHSTLLNRYGRLELFRDRDKTLISYVGILTHVSRRPPDKKIPPGEALALLLWFARVHPRAFRIALPWIWREQMADLTCRIELSGAEREAKN